MSLQVVVLCAGKGTRMKSEKSKVMHEIMGKPMIEYVYEIAKEVSDKKPIFIVGHAKEQIESYFKDKVEYVHQDEQLGTGHAVILAEKKINENDDVLILYGDTPLIQASTIKKLIEDKKDDTPVTILTSMVDNPFGYGRIVKDINGDFVKIVEQKDTNDEEKLIREINSGMSYISGKLIKENINKITNNNNQKEYYLTDLFEILKNNGNKISTFFIEQDEIMGVNSRTQLEDARKVMSKRINSFHMDNGVTLISPESIYIEKDVVIGRDTIIYPNNILRGKTDIGNNCILYAGNEIVDTVIKDNVTIRTSFLEESYVDEKTTIGPYAHLRPKSKLGKKVKIGNFVEVKNSIMGNNSKASHLAYVGDGDIGDNVNIGCGVVFVNYDGKHKNRSIVKDNAFIGSNSNLVAPVTIEEKGYVATGSTVTDNVPANSLCIARARQVIKAGWTAKKKLLD